MGNYSSGARRPATGSSPVRSTAPARTHEGGDGRARDAKSELYLTAVSTMVGEGNAYESGDARLERMRELVAAVVDADPQWLAGFIPWLRSEAQVRTGSVVLAAETARAMHVHRRNRVTAASPISVRRIVDSACQRADEPAEVLAYWRTTYGRTLPDGLRRGVADAAVRLYTERSAMKWDGTDRAWRMGDVLAVTHPTPKDPRQAALFRYLIDRRYGRAEGDYGLPAVHRRQWLDAMVPAARRSWLASDPESAGRELQQAGHDWRSLATWLQGPLDATAWEAILPGLGYMAILRNLRNLDEAGLSNETAEAVARKLMDPAEVRVSRQFPLRFISAAREVRSLRWAWPLERALQLSLDNIPELNGRTLVMIDTSGSMGEQMSDRSGLLRRDAAVIFGLAVAQRCQRVDVVSFSAPRYIGEPASLAFPLLQGESLSTSVKRWDDGYHIGSGTRTYEALQRHYCGHDRVIVVTDEQYHGPDPSIALSPDVPMYTWNVAGHRAGGRTGRNRHTFGGLTDAAFRVVPLLEAGRTVAWPWMGADQVSE